MKTSPTKTTVDNGGKDYTNPEEQDGIESGSIKYGVVRSAAPHERVTLELVLEAIRSGGA